MDHHFFLRRFGPNTVMFIGGSRLFRHFRIKSIKLTFTEKDKAVRIKKLQEKRGHVCTVAVIVLGFSFVRLTCELSVLPKVQL